MPKIDKYSEFINNIYGAIMKDIDLPEGNLISLEGAINLFNKIKVVVHSNDHDTHFHVQDIAKSIDARFDYPVIKLRDYSKKSRGQFNSRQIKRIVTTCNNSIYHQWIGDELSRRGDR